MAKKLLFLCVCLTMALDGFCQTTNVKCSYLATHCISDAIKNMEDAHIRELAIKKLKEAKKLYEMSYSDNIYYFSLTGSVADKDIVTIEQGNCHYIDFGSDSVFIQKQILDKTFLVADTVKHPSWTISEEKKEINGMECFKATASEGNTRKYIVTAWFSPEIAVPYGPLGYFGLPGLIVELETPTHI